MCYNEQVVREWKFYDDAIIRSELDALPVKDSAKLIALMEHYKAVGGGNPSPAMINDYSDGLKRMRHIKPAYKGRLLFFVADRTPDYERLVVLTVFKKESQDVPRSVLERAAIRKRLYVNEE